MESTIRLFKALSITKKGKKNPSKELLEKTIKRGFVFAPEVIANYSDYDSLIELVEKEIGLTAEQMNASFHKSWEKIKSSDNEKLFYEQIIHYFTTYGFEELGIYSEDSIYLPHEKLEIPGLKEDVKLTLIRGLTKKELKEKILSFLGSGIALKEDTISDVVEVCEFTEFGSKDVDLIRNREVKIKLYDLLDKIPENPTEFLRYLIFKSTNETLIIKNKDLIEKIKESEFNSLKLLKRYKKENGLQRLSEVFYRFKPLLLAFKKDAQSNKLINKVRKYAVKNHKPMPEDYLNLVTSRINKIDLGVLKKELKKVNIFRKVRLAYALKYRTVDTESILYKVRNGKGYAKEFSSKNKSAAKKILGIVLESIIEDIKKNVKGKKIYLPEEIHYTLPATEKQFIGDFPSGTYVSVDKDIVIGIYWKDVDEHRIDLDLSLLDVDNKIGWDSAYRTDNAGILFSGDITAAPHGASELYYSRKQVKHPYLMNLNYYNFDGDIEVPFKILVAKQEVRNLKNNYMVDPNSMVAVCKSKINKKQMILGLLVPTSSGNRFYFSEVAIGKSITSSNSDSTKHARKYLIDFYNNPIELKDLLEKAGAKFVKKDKCEIDLSPENIERDTILNLIKKNGNK